MVTYKFRQGIEVAFTGTWLSYMPPMHQSINISFLEEKIGEHLKKKIPVVGRENDLIRRM